MKQESNKQKISISAMKRVFSALLVVVVLCSISIAFADDYYFSSSNQPVTYTGSTANAPSLAVFTTYYSNYQSERLSKIVVSQDHVYACVSYYTLNDVQTPYLLLLSTSSFTSWSSHNTNISSSSSLNTDYNYYYVQYWHASDPVSQTLNTSYVPIYTSDEEAFTAFNNWIVNGDDGSSGGGSNGFSMNYSLPAGNIIYIEFNSSFDSFNLQCTMPTTSYAIGSTPWPESNQYYGFASSLPSGTLTPPTSKIEWTRNGRTSIGGITNNAVFEYGPHHPTSGNYLVVYNPAYYGGTNNGPYEFMNNGAINIQATNVVSYVAYQLDSQLVQINPGGNLDIETSLTGVEYPGDFDEETGDMIWTNGNQPIDGGGNLPTSSESGFQSFLSNLVQKIVNVFAPAQQAIQTLANAVSNFGSWMYSLYIWLPAPVLNLLTSAITLAIIIGVIKVFL